MAKINCFHVTDKKTHCGSDGEEDHQQLAQDKDLNQRVGLLY